MQSYEVKTVHNSYREGGTTWRVIKADDIVSHLKHARHGESFTSSLCGRFYYVPERWAEAEEVQSDGEV